MTRQRIHQGSHRKSRTTRTSRTSCKARRSPRPAHLDPRGSFPPPDASRTLRRTLAAAATTAGLCGLVAAPQADEVKGLDPVPPAAEERGLAPVPPAAGAQAVRGLVIGIDDYTPHPPGPGKLKGAVNDARGHPRSAHRDRCRGSHGPARRGRDPGAHRDRMAGPPGTGRAGRYAGADLCRTRLAGEARARARDGARREGRSTESWAASGVRGTGPASGSSTTSSTSGSWTRAGRS